MNKVTLNIPICQQKNKQIISYNKGFSISIPQPEDVVRYIKSLSVAGQSVVKTLLDEHSRSPRIRTSRDTLAAKSGCHPNHVSRILKKLSLKGLIYKWQPGGETNVYKWEPVVTESSVMAELKRFFRIFVCFNIGLLTVKSGCIPVVTHLTLNDKRDATVNEYSSSLLYLPEVAPWVYSSKEKGEPNKKVPFEQFEAQFFPKEQYVNSFTQEQLVQLAPYPKDILIYATKMLTRDMAAGKSIGNQFAYFKSICERQQQKNPQSGYSKPAARPSTGPQSVYKAIERIVESDYEFAFNMERILHDKVLNDPTLHPNAKRYANPKWKLITPEEQQEIMKTIHQDCSCRDNVDFDLHNDKEVMEAKKKQEVVQNIKNWNDMIMKSEPMVTDGNFSHEVNQIGNVVIFPTDSLVSDNSSKFMSNQDEPALGSDVTGYLEETFDDCY